MLLCVNVQNIDKIPLVNCPVLIIHVSFLWRCCIICCFWVGLRNNYFCIGYMVSFFLNILYLGLIFSLFFFPLFKKFLYLYCRLFTYWFISEVLYRDYVNNYFLIIIIWHRMPLLCLVCGIGRLLSPWTSYLKFRKYKIFLTWIALCR